MVWNEISYLMSTMLLFEFRQSSLLYRFPIPQKRLFAEDECWEDDSSIHCDHSPFGTLLYSKQGQFSFSDIFRSLLRVSDEGKLFKLNRKRKFLHFILKFWCLFTSFCKLENFCNNLFFLFRMLKLRNSLNTRFEWNECYIWKVWTKFNLIILFETD